MRLRSFLALLALTFSVGSCDTPVDIDPPGRELSRGAATAMASHLMMAGWQAGTSSPAAGGASYDGPARAAAEEEPVDTTYTGLMQCARGGEIRSLHSPIIKTDETGTGEIWFQMVQVPDACIIDSPEGPIILDGRPDVALEGVLAVEDYVPNGAQVFQMTGAVYWGFPQGTDQGVCSFDLQFAYEISYGDDGEPAFETGMRGEACGYSYGEGEDEEAATIILHPTAVIVAIDSTKTIRASVRDADGTPIPGAPVTWSSANTEIATVTDGVVTGRKEGTTTITARSGQASATASVEVSEDPRVAEVAVEPKSDTLTTGADLSVDVFVYDQFGDEMDQEPVSWTSDNEEVATVSGDKDGATVTAQAGGTATITATADTVEGKLTVSVEDTARLDTVRLEPVELELEVGQNGNIYASTNDQFDNYYPYGGDYTWSVADPSIARYYNATAYSGTNRGGFEALEPGVTEVTVTASDSTGSASAVATVTVRDTARLETVEVNPASSTLQVGNEVTLTAAGYDQWGEPYEAAFEWASTDPAVASIADAASTTAVVLASAAGEASISASAKGVVGTATVVVESKDLESIRIDPETATVFEGETVQFNATGYDQNGDVMGDVSFTWTSASPAVATVENGLATGLEKGTATLQASATNSRGETVTGTATLEVRGPILTTIQVEPATLALIEDKAPKALTATGYDQNGDVMGDVSFTWSSEAPAVASVSSAGQVQGEAPGTTTVTASATNQDDEVIAGGAAVTVEPRRVTTIDLLPTSADLKQGETVDFGATAYDQEGDAMPATFSWASSVPDVASVSGAGLVTALDGGSPELEYRSTDISATADGVSAKAPVTVRDTARLTSLELDPQTLILPVLGTATVSATGHDQWGEPMTTDVAITWSSTDGDIATVTAKGEVEGVGTGETQLTATATDHPDITAEATVYVDPSIPTRIELTPNAVTLKEGAETQIDVVVYDQWDLNILDAQVTWLSADGSVATVSDGWVTAVGEGLTDVAANITWDVYVPSEGTRNSGEMEAAATVEVYAQVVSGIELSPTSANLPYDGHTTQLAATVVDQEGEGMPDVPVSWSSSHPSVASVDGTGLVTSDSAGITTITATAEGYAATATVTVEGPEPTEIYLYPTEATVLVGEYERVDATVYDQWGGRLRDAEITWTSSDAAVATVDSTGTVWGDSAGTATITATAGDASAEMAVTVEQRRAESINLNPTEALVATGSGLEINAWVYDQYGMNYWDAEVTWTSSNEAVATVEGGLVTALSPGTVTITAQSDDATATATITVEDPEPTTINMSPSSTTLSVGSTTGLSAYVYDQFGYWMRDADVTWTSSNTSVATVDSSGTVTAVGEGEAIITATSGDVSGEATVTATP